MAHPKKIKCVDCGKKHPWHHGDDVEFSSPDVIDEKRIEFGVEVPLMCDECDAHVGNISFVGGFDIPKDTDLEIFEE